MSLIPKLYVIFHTTGLLISLALLAHAWTRRKTAAGRASAGMMISTCIWLISWLLAWLSDIPDVKFFWNQAGYLGVLTLPVAWFAFAMVLSGYERWLTPRYLLIALVIPAFVYVLVVTGAYFKEVVFVTENGETNILVTFSPWLWLGSAYSYGLIAVGAVLMIRSALRSTRMRRLQAAALISAAVLPVIANLAYLFQIIPGLQDLTSLTFTLSAMILTLGRFRVSLFDLVPIGRGAVMDRVSDGVVIVDENGRVADLNRAAQQIIAVRLEQGVRKPLARLAPALADALASAPARHAEVLLEKDGHPNYYEALATPLHQFKDNVVGHLIVLHDITARKQVETGLKAALERERELGEMKSRFYSYFSHQLRTPLSVVMSSTELLEHYGRKWSDEKRNLHFQRIYQAVARLLELSRQVSTFEKSEQRIEALCPRYFDPEEFSQSVVDEIRSTEGARHVIQFEARGASLEAFQDSDLLRQALENLLGNALKFSPAGQRIILSLEASPDELCFTIRDEGCGIPAGDLPRVFQPFFRASNAATIPGTGLGLAIANQYACRLGGELRLESQENCGTTATLTVPLTLKE